MGRHHGLVGPPAAWRATGGHPVGLLGGLVADGKPRTGEQVRHLVRRHRASSVEVGRNGSHWVHPAVATGLRRVRLKRRAWLATRREHAVSAAPGAGCVRDTCTSPLRRRWRLKKCHATAVARPHTHASSSRGGRRRCQRSRVRGATGSRPNPVLPATPGDWRPRPRAATPRNSVVTLRVAWCCHVAAICRGATRR